MAKACGANAFIVLAKSGRQIAQSLYCAGVDSIVIDQFGDEDTQACASHFFIIDDFSIDRIIAAIKSLNLNEAPRIIYAGGIDNTLDVLEQLEADYDVFGNKADVVRSIRKPRYFFKLLDDLGIAYPPINYEHPLEPDWLLKDNNQEGGYGIRYAQLTNDQTLDENSYYQKQLHGQPFSVLFLANASEGARIVGLNTQWVVDDNALHPYLFRGIINRFALSEERFVLIRSWINQIVLSVKLKGLNSLDCLIVDGEIVVLEVNPRPGASLCLYDDDYQYGLMQQHIHSFIDQPWDQPIQQERVTGSWINYAPSALTIRKDIAWPSWVKDRPVADSGFSQGEPVCTVMAKGISAEDVRHQLIQRCESINNTLLDSGD